MLIARCAAVLGFLTIAGVGCSHSDCSTICTGNQTAGFDLSCAPTNLTSVALSGVCAIGDAGLSDDLINSASRSLYVSSPSPGVCHVALTFATGFIFSADVTFTLKTDPMPAGCGACSYTAPIQPDFMVDNPTATCVDAGLDAGADTLLDAPDAPTVDADGDAGEDD